MHIFAINITASKIIPFRRFVKIFAIKIINREVENEIGKNEVSNEYKSPFYRL